MTSWGTGYQGGLPIGFVHPDQTRLSQSSKLLQKNLQSLNRDSDQQSVVSMDFSNAPSSVLSFKCRELQIRLAEQKKAKGLLLKQMVSLKEQQRENERQVQINTMGDKEKKMALFDKRNLIHSATNYMRHPQIEDL